jgi:hypothetical protein
MLITLNKQKETLGFEYFDRYGTCDYQIKVDKHGAYEIGHFNFNHYCNVIQAKYEDLYNNTLLPTEPESKEKENDYDS